MFQRIGVLGVTLFLTSTILAGEPAITVYNQGFAVVRDTVPLDLKSGTTEVRFADTTMHLEPTSVILRDPAGKNPVQILEQLYRADPVSQNLLLSLYEGQTIDFQRINQDGQVQIVKGKIIRSGYVPHSQAYSRYGQQYQMRQQSMAYYDPGTSQPVIEVDGKLMFQLPGLPLFPKLADDTVLKPTLAWQIQSDKPAKFDAELSYVTGGMSWWADYNVVAPEKGDMLDIVGWVSMDNQSGKTFTNAKIKLLAGTVNKLSDVGRDEYVVTQSALRGGASGTPPVSEKAFDEYHLYTLNRPTSLRDRETKQVEFVRAMGVKSELLYVYDGAYIGPNFRHWDINSIRNNREYGTQCNPKIWVMREFMNTEANHLGIPLPKGKLRFYRQDNDGRQEFVGENVIDHTPKDEKVRVYTGDSFDLVGERRQTHFEINTDKNWLDESFEIKLRNHKKEPVEIRVVEHLYRWINWEIKAKSQDYIKQDSRTIEFRVKVDPDKEATITYTVHYWW